MLPRHARLTSTNDFARTTKSGFRVSSKFLVIYLYPTLTDNPAQFGLIINKSVGGSVVRHKIARQIRHGLAKHISSFPNGALVVVRALPSIIGKNIQADVDDLVAKVLTKAMAAK